MRASSVLPTPVGTEEEERADRPVGIGEAGSRPADGAGHRGDGLVLSDHALVEHVLHADELGGLTLHEAGHRDAGPLGHDLGDVLRVDLLLEHAGAALEVGERDARLLDLALDLGDAAVADLGGLLEVGLPLELGAQVLELLLERPDPADGLLLVRPAGEHGVALLGEVRQLAVQGVETIAAGGVGLLGEGDPLDLELTDTALDDVDLRGQRIDLDAELGGRLVHEVDGLVREEAAGEVAIGQHRGRHQRGVLDADAVVHLVALLQARAGSRSCRRRWVGRRTPAGSGARGRRPSRCAAGTRRAWWRRSDAADRGRAAASACSRRPSTPRPRRPRPRCGARR